MNEIVSPIVVALVAFAVLSSVARRFDPSERGWLALSLAMHLGSAVALILILRLMGGDLFGFYRVGLLLSERFTRSPGDTLPVIWGLLTQSGDPLPFPDLGLNHGSSGSMIVLSAATLLATGGSLYGSCMLAGALSFFAKVRIYEVFRSELGAQLRSRVQAATLLVPSVIFWSSGLIKEAFATVGLGLVFKELPRLYRGKFSLEGLLIAALGLFIIAIIKGYVLIPLGMAAVAVVALTRRREAARFRRIVTIAMGIAVISGAGIVSARYNPENISEEASRIQENGEETEGGSNYEIVTERSTAGQLAAAPLALITSFFRPVIFEAHNAQMLANAVEMLVLTWFILRAVGTGAEGYRYVRQEPILVFSVVFAVVMGVGVGLASTNLGTLSRYRMPMMPFLWVAATVIAAPRKRAAATAPTKSLASAARGTVAPTA